MDLEVVVLHSDGWHSVFDPIHGAEQDVSGVEEAKTVFASLTPKEIWRVSPFRMLFRPQDKTRMGMYRFLHCWFEFWTIWTNSIPVACPPDLSFIHAISTSFVSPLAPSRDLWLCGCLRDFEHQPQFQPQLAGFIYDCCCEF